MAWSCKILADSLPLSGHRLTTFEVTYPRFIHSEFMTHRAISRNAASSRAIPVEKMLARVKDDPAMPVWWGKNQKGMQALEELTGHERVMSEKEWLLARDHAVTRAESMLAWGAHKQIVNRLLEPFCWITVIASATDWGNFFNLRCHKDAQPEFQKIAYMMGDDYLSNKPRFVANDYVHAPLVSSVDDWAILDLAGLDAKAQTDVIKKVSTGRCARVSYLTHDGRRDINEDIALHDRLIGPGHWSPFEHVATASSDQNLRSGNFRGWFQYRKDFENENRTEYTRPDPVHLRKRT
jgi:thymidylate synthase ThyX